MTRQCTPGAPLACHCGVALLLASVVTGAFAFHYATPLTPAQVDWYGRFGVLVTHDPLPRAQVDALHKRGTKLILYEWSVAFYDSLASPWQRSLIHTGALLNATPLYGGAGSPTSGAWYYDPTQQREQRAAAIARRLHDIGYDGVFLDTTTAASVHPEALAEFRKRHPKADYDVEYGRFLAQLRHALAHQLIFTNQGYRSAANYLPYADWDLSESLITFPRGGHYVPRPWNDPADPWNSIRFLFDHVITPAHREYPHVRFGHLNYADKPDEPSARRAVAIAKMFDGSAYIAGDEHSPLYFLDLGRAAAPRVDRGDASYRFFARGVVAVNASRTPLTIPNPQHQKYVDPESGRVLTTLVVPPGDAIVLTRRSAR